MASQNQGQAEARTEAEDKEGNWKLLCHRVLALEKEGTKEQRGKKGGKGHSPGSAGAIQPYRDESDLQAPEL